MEDGAISISACDTAWVALGEDANGGGKPLFRESREWIANNQLEDGSWGDEEICLAHDQLLNTIGCIVAFWNMHPDKIEKVLSFKDNLSRLEEDHRTRADWRRSSFPFDCRASSKSRH